MAFYQLLVLTSLSPSDTPYTSIFPETEHANQRELVRSLCRQERTVEYHKTQYTLCELLFIHQQFI